MKKIYLILMLVIPSYGFSLNYQIGNVSCGVFLDEMDRNVDKGQWYMMYAVGWFEAHNFLSKNGVLAGMTENQFSPDQSVLRRALIAHCNDNLSENFYLAVGNVWFTGVKLKEIGSLD